MVKGLFVSSTVDNRRSVCLCLLPDASGQGEEMARIRLLSSAIVMDVFDSRNIQDRSLLKVYNKDPSHAFNHMAKAVNGDVRVSTAVVVQTVFPARSVPASHSQPPSTTTFPGIMLLVSSGDSFVHW